MGLLDLLFPEFLLVKLGIRAALYGILILFALYVGWQLGVVQPVVGGMVRSLFGV